MTTSLRKTLVTLALCFVVAACKTEREAPAPATTADPAPAETAPIAEAADPDDAPPVQVELPKVCADYLDRVKACIAKTSGSDAAVQFQASLDASMEEWRKAEDTSALVPTCEAADRQFAEMASKLQCE